MRTNAFREWYDASCEVYEQDEPTCIACPECSALNYSAGQLRNLEYFVCRDCGLWYRANNGEIVTC